MDKANKYKLNLVNDISGLSYDPNTLEVFKKNKKTVCIKSYKR